MLTGRAVLPATRPLEAAVGAVARAGSRGQPLRRDQQDPPLPRRRGVRRGHHHGAVRHVAVRRRPSARSRGPRGPEPSDATLVAKGVEGIARFPVRVARRALHAARHPTETLGEMREGRRGARQHRVEVRESAASDSAQRADRPAPAGAVDPHAARGPEVDQERARRDGQRRVPRRRVGRARPHAAAARRAHGGPRAARHRPGVRPRGGPGTARSATASRRCSGRCPCTRATRASACAS